MKTTSFRPSRRSFLLFGAAAVGSSVFLFSKSLDAFEGQEVTPPDAHAAAARGDLVLIDIRRPDEWDRTGIPEHSRPLDMRREDFEQALLEITGGDLTRPVALICARGVRSDRMSTRLAAAGFTRIIDVPEGMLGSRAGPGWLERGLPVARP